MDQALSAPHSDRARERSVEMRAKAARLFLKVLLPLICIVVFVNILASLRPVFYPDRLMVELVVLASVIPAVILYRAKRNIEAMYITLSISSSR